MKYSPRFCSSNTEKGKKVEFIKQKVDETLSYIPKKKVYCTSSKIDKSWLKYSLSIYDYVIAQQLDDICKGKQDGKIWLKSCFDGG